jgi:1-acyl-sn-glycerol-3-phosphate acyltransferase
MTRTPPLYALARHTLGRYLRRTWRPTVTGLEHLPATGGAILAANHLSIGDQLFLGILTPRHIAFWAKAEYFRRGPVTRRVVTGMGAIPVERGGGRAALAAFDAAVPVLHAGGLVAVFPEGTRSPDGRLYRGRTGVVRLAHRAGVPIVPVGIRGTDRLRPPGSRRPHRHPVTVSFGPRLDVLVTGPADIRRATDALMAAIRELTDQEYVPRYAPPRAA